MARCFANNPLDVIGLPIGFVAVFSRAGRTRFKSGTMGDYWTNDPYT